jgi:hypothetical protein
MKLGEKAGGSVASILKPGSKRYNGQDYRKILSGAKAKLVRIDASRSHSKETTQEKKVMEKSGSMFSVF